MNHNHYLSIICAVLQVDLEVLEADHLYTKAMIYSDSDSEEHVRAVANRQRQDLGVSNSLHESN